MKEKQLEEALIRIQEGENELYNLREQQQKQSELHKEEMKQLIKQLKQLQQSAERDCKHSELIHNCALEVERQKWEAREARLTVQLDEAMQRIVVLQDQSKERVLDC